MELPDINILKLDFRLRATDAATLPPFLGSTLRGAFGSALKKVFCFVPGGVCRTTERNAAGVIETASRCWFYEACPYQYIFESPNLMPRESNHPKLRGVGEVPPPFVLVAPAPLPRNRPTTCAPAGRMKNFNEDYRFNRFSPGDALEFSILLLGRAVHFWAQILVAARLAAETGLGEADSRTAFVLERAFAHDEKGLGLEIFAAQNPSVAARGIAPVKLRRAVDSALGILENRNGGEAKIEIEFSAPASQRILLDDGRSGSLKFYNLVKKISERLEFLARLHAEPAQAIDYRGILEEAKTVAAAQTSLRYYIYEQDSKRKKRIIRRDVFTGKIIYRGNQLAEYLPLLKAGEIINVGTDTSHGMGKFSIFARFAEHSFH